MLFHTCVYVFTCVVVLRTRNLGQPDHCLPFVQSGHPNKGFLRQPSDTSRSRRPRVFQSTCTLHERAELYLFQSKFLPLLSVFLLWENRRDTRDQSSGNVGNIQPEGQPLNRDGGHEALNCNGNPHDTPVNNAGGDWFNDPITAVWPEPNDGSTSNKNGTGESGPNDNQGGEGGEQTNPNGTGSTTGYTHCDLLFTFYWYKS